MSRAQPDRRQIPVTEEELDATFGPATPVVLDPASLPEDEQLADLLKRAIAGPPRVLLSESPASLAAALALFQSQLPDVIAADEADIEAKEGKRSYRYRYANLADVSRVGMRMLGRYGLSFSAKPTMTPEGFGLAYILRHTSGEEDGGFWPLPKPGTADPKTIGSHITYARRYCFQAVTGLAPAEDDDDADAASAGHQRAESRREERDRGDFQARIARAEPKDLAAFWERMEPEGRTEEMSARFGARLAEIIETPRNRDEWVALNKTLGAVGEARLPWSHEGVGPVERHSRHGQVLAEATRKPADGTLAEELELAIVECRTFDDLRHVDKRISHAIQGGGVSAAAGERLRTVQAERQGALQREEDRARMGPLPGTGHADNAEALDELPEQDEPMENYDDEPVPEFWPPTIGTPSVAYLDTRTRIRSPELTDGKSIAALMDDLLGLFERGEVSADEHAALDAMLRSLPAVHLNLFNFAAWLAETAISMEELDAVTLLVNKDRQQAEPQLDAKLAERAYAGVAARRFYLKEGK